eukprot:Nitzschia sp. Nitz4//scaffold1_size375055//26342//27325//NITZ4_000212-RA/size375055-processed-gene-0.8-mRNA-1//1//CDS//3329540853//225//frame0
MAIGVVAVLFLYFHSLSTGSMMFQLTSVVPTLSRQCRTALLVSNPERFFSTIRLSKRLSELDVCSRREADRWIQEGRVKVNGEVAVLGQKVEAGLPRSDIEVLQDKSNDSVFGGQSETITSAVVLNKPSGYVAGQPEHGHTPAARLLTRDTLWNTDASDIVLPGNSWRGFAPAGRLDRESTGLMVFSHTGIISKKLINHESTLEKEYIVEVAPATKASRGELRIDENFRLPPPSLDLTPMTEGGKLLLGDHRPLKPCKATWLKSGSLLQIILTEGKKRHIRRACRELIGYHVVSLDRVRVGPIEKGDLPVGCWRPLSQEEIDQILES